MVALSGVTSILSVIGAQGVAEYPLGASANAEFLMIAPSEGTTFILQTKMCARN